MSYARQAVTRLTLNMAIPVVQKSVSCTVGDVNRRWEVTLTHNGDPFALPSDWTAFLAGIKPDGTRMANACLVDGGRIIYDFAGGPEIATCPGVFPVVFEIFDEQGEPVASPKVWVNVADNPGARIVNSSDQFSVLSELIGRISGAQENVDELRESVVDLMNKATFTGHITIPATEWTDITPRYAFLNIPGDSLTKGGLLLFVPEDDGTREICARARISVKIDDTVDSDPPSKDSIWFLRAESGEVPDSPLHFTYFSIRTDAEDQKAVAAIIGVDAYGEGGGVDQAAVEDTVRRLIPAWALEEEPPEERDPSVYNWAKAATKPSYTAAEVGADPAGKAAGLLSAHNVSEDAHNDIRMLVEEHREEVNALLAVDDSTLNELSEIVAYIKNNKSLIESITDSKVSKTDIVNNLTTNVANKPLSAAQGVAIKSLIDAKIGTDDLAAEVEAQIEAAKESGELGARGPGILKVSTTPTSWTQAIGGKNPIKRMSIATIKKEAYVDEVIIGDNIQHSYNLYRIYYLDDTYAYMDTTQNLRGSQGSAGTSAYKYAQNGGYTGTEAQFTESLAIAGDIQEHIPSKTSQLTNDSGYVTSSNAETWTFTLANGSTVTKKVVLA